ncbi:cyclic peptide export ABC transporter [bacterium]|nr:cyclic peptide export ABC transporter [bacterium]
MECLIRLLRPARWLAAAATSASVLSGACAAGLLAALNSTLAGGAVSAAATAFGLLCVGKVAGQVAAQLLLNRLAQRSVAQLRAELSDEIVGAPLRRVEQLGSERLLTALTDDVTAVSDMLHAVPGLVVNLALISVCTAYLGWLSWPVMLGALVVVALGGGGYLILRRRAYRCLRAGRGAYERLFRLFRHLTEGGKELRLYRNQRDALFTEDVRPSLEACRRHGVRANDSFTLLDGWVQSLFYLLIGSLVFVLPVWHEVPTRVLTGYLLTVLFLMRPVVAVLNLVPVLSRGGVASQSLERLRSELGWGGARAPKSRPLPATGVELSGVTYRYQSEEGGFRLGPVDFRLVPGEVVFVVGGNGSGKSTLAKLVTGLYEPEEGEVRVDGFPVGASDYDNYRQLFSAVFSDGYVLDRLAGAARHDPARQLIDELRIAHRVRIEGGRLVTAGVSHGESKRLALLLAYLEDRPFFVLDEWAANQDPFFKQTFYTRLLPELRAQGKGVLVITHDDRYFSKANRIVRMENGMIEEARHPVCERN